jgi:hypothetical protein
MTLHELITESASEEAKARLLYQSLRNDNSQARTDSLRKSRLTLRQLNRLRKIRDARKLDHQLKIARIHRQYWPQQPNQNS